MLKASKALTSLSVIFIALYISVRRAMKRGSLNFALNYLIVLSISILSPGNALSLILLAIVKGLYAAKRKLSAFSLKYSPPFSDIS